MNTHRKTSLIAGILYIIGTVTGIVSMVLSAPVRDAQDVLASAAAGASQVRVAALFVLLMGLSLAMFSVVLYPILKKHSEALAIGYVVFRGALETVTYFVTAVSWLLLLGLGQLYVNAGAPAASSFQASAALVLKTGDINTSMTGIVFCSGALMFYAVLYQSRLVPRWISVWGLASLIPYLAAESLALFALLDPLSTTAVVLHLPLAVQEMVLAVWLIVKGFNRTAIAALSAKQP